MPEGKIIKTIRLMITETLLLWALRVAPSDSDESYDLAEAIALYMASTVKKVKEG